MKTEKYLKKFIADLVEDMEEDEFDSGDLGYCIFLLQVALFMNEKGNEEKLEKNLIDCVKVAKHHATDTVYSSK
jgi:hypothetical protein